MACCSVVSHWCKWSVYNVTMFTRWPVFPKCMQLTLVSWYVASMLCWYFGMFSWSDALPMQCYLLWVFCQCGRADLCVLICLVPYQSIFLHEIGAISWLTLWRWWLHSCGMFILLVEYGLVHRGDCINCETCYFCFDPAFVWPSLGRADFHSA